LIQVVYFTLTMRYGKRVGKNPWGAVGLEWQTTSPPPTHNFDTTPVVDWDAYQYKEKEAAHV
jgi:cytochrome c oxidase subunit 1